MRTILEHQPRERPMSEPLVRRPEQTLSQAHQLEGTPLPRVTLSLPPGPTELPSLSDPAESAAASSLQDHLGRYEIHGEIGRGGMGAVLRGHDPVLRRQLALKVLLTGRQGNADALRRFHEEAQIGGQLQHPGLVPVYELGRDPNGRPFFAMKLVEGRTLADLLAERKIPSDDWTRFLQIFEQICQAVGYAHARGVIHRDLKPANIMVGAFGEVQVMDWGLAKVLGAPSAVEAGTPAGHGTVHTERSQSGGSESHAGSVMGTPAYMPPEQARGETDQLDARADVFGLGAILCEILTGAPPFQGKDITEVLSKAARGDLTDAFARLDGSGADVDLAALAHDCLAPQATDRPADGGTVAARVAAYRAGVQERLRTAELERARAEARAIEERRRRRAQLALAGAGLLLLTLVGAAGWWVRTQRLEVERKQREVERAVERDLAEVVERQGQMRWTEAWAALERAEGHLGDSGPAALREQLVQTRRDLTQIRTDQDMIGRLEEARIQRSGIRGLRLADEAYREAFAWYGLDLEKLAEEVAADKIGASAIREDLVSALYQWAMLLRLRKPEAESKAQAKSKARLAVRADADPWRRQIAEAAIHEDQPTLLALLGQADSATLSPSTALFVAGCYDLVEKEEAALTLLREVWCRHPNDFMINFALARCYEAVNPPQLAEAVRFFTAAHVLRPRRAGVVVAMGHALAAQGKHGEALLAYQKACRLRPEYAEVHATLGSALTEAGKLSEAAAACREAIRLQGDNFRHHDLLASVLRDQGQLLESEAVCREAIRLAEDDPRPHCALGFALRLQGRFEASRDAFRRGEELNRQLPKADLAAAEYLREAERFVELERRLPDIVAGTSTPANAAEQLKFAYVAGLKHQYAAAVRLYTDSLRTEPDLALDPAKETRSTAAGYAALSATGKDKEAASLDEPERARLRTLALGWLRDDLAAWQKRLDAGKPTDRIFVARTMRLWQTHPDLASVRDVDAIARLPETERALWQKLWQDANALLKRADEAK
jgi:tetratricopeptide (TPR) repeat protein